MDLYDSAQDYEARSRAAAISEALIPPAGMEEGPYWLEGNAHCRWCESIIPERRLRAVPGTGLCVECATTAQTVEVR